MDLFSSDYRWRWTAAHGLLKHKRIFGQPFLCWPPPSTLCSHCVCRDACSSCWAWLHCLLPNYDSSFHSKLFQATIQATVCIWKPRAMTHLSSWMGWNGINWKHSNCKEQKLAWPISKVHKSQRIGAEQLEDSKGEKMKIYLVIKYAKELVACGHFSLFQVNIFLVILNLLWTHNVAVGWGSHFGT